MSDKMENLLTLVECPRDAWQGIAAFIPTALKAEYLQALIDTGFTVIDAGSFVSPRAVPQVSDTSALLEKVSTEKSPSKLLVIVANTKGAELACREEKVAYVGYPFSVSETFQLKNTNAPILRSFETVAGIRELCEKSNKKLVIYISMGFGNPYGDLWSPEIVESWVEKLSALDIRTFSLADTVGLAQPSDIRYLFQNLSSRYPALELGAHFHSRPEAWLEKVSAAYESGCRRFDGTISGFGGCPFAQDDLVGNISTENLLWFAGEKGREVSLNGEAFGKAQEIFREKIAPFQKF